MDSSFVPWEGSAEYHVDGEVLIHGHRPQHHFERDDEVITDQEVESHIFQTETSQICESSLEVKMMEMMNLDTTGEDFVISENICVDTERKDEEQIKHFIEEPKMCNEKTATYWTGGGGESQCEEELPSFLNEEELLSFLSEEKIPSLLNDMQLDVDNTTSYLPDESKPSQGNTQIYLPLKKTLRNLRLLDLKLKYNSHQFTLDNPGQECNNDSSSSSDESESKFPESTVEETNNDEEAHHSFLIDLLTQCHNKLEQMEALRVGSSKLFHRLWEAETTIEYLKEKIAELHRENVKKEEEIFFLTEELMKSRRILHQFMEGAIEERTNIAYPRSLTFNKPQHDLESICLENEHSEENNQTDQNTSKICVIL
ncbi:uncharacterized protein ACMZJ9_012275 [Mantella aurantiaca]